MLKGHQACPVIWIRDEPQRSEVASCTKGSVKTPERKGRSVLDSRPRAARRTSPAAVDRTARTGGELSLRGRIGPAWIPFEAQICFDVAEHDESTVNEILNDRRTITPEMAVRIGHVFGTSAEYWMRLKLAVNLFDAMRSPARAEVERLPVLVAVNAYDCAD